MARKPEVDERTKALQAARAALTEVSVARAAAAAVQAKYAAAFVEYDAAVAVAALAEARFKDLVRPTGVTELQAAGLAATITYPTTKTYDPVRLLAVFPNAVGVPGLIVQAINKTVLERQIDLGVIPASLAEKAAIVTPKTPAVTIKAAPKLVPANLLGDR